MTVLRERILEDLKLRGFAPSTRENYVSVVRQLAKYHRRSPDELTEDDIRRYFAHLTDVKKVARSTATIVLDFIHVLQYLWEAANALCGTGTDTAERWVCERALRLLEGRVSDVAAGIRRSATLRNLKSVRREAVDKCADYLLKYREMIRYDECLVAGFPIATGVIEGACRHLVKDRLDITGARWGLAGAEAILKLRSLRASGDFELYWQFHQRQRLEGNHLRHFAPNELRVAG